MGMREKGEISDYGGRRLLAFVCFFFFSMLTRWCIISYILRYLLIDLGKKSPRYFSLSAIFYLAQISFSYETDRMWQNHEFIRLAMTNSCTKSLLEFHRPFDRLLPYGGQVDWHKQQDRPRVNTIMSWHSAIGTRRSLQCRSGRLSPFRGQNTWGTRYRNKFFPRANPDAKRDPTIHF